MTDKKLHISADTTQRESEGLLDAYMGVVRRMGRSIGRYLRGGDEAEDVWQEVFARLWVRREEIAPDEAARIVATAARNMAIDSWRTGRRRQIVAIDEERDGGESRAPDEDYAAREKYETVTCLMLTELTDVQRRVMEMRDVEGRTYDEIASTLGMEETTVRMNLSRARRKIRDLYNQMED